MLSDTLEAAPGKDATAASVQAEPDQESGHESIWESVASICSVLAVGLFVMTFVFQNFEIPSGSMEKTLLIGDHVLVDRVTLAPPTPWAFWMPYREVRRGDVIVFLKPGEPGLFLVKRAIAIAGDRIHLRHGVVYLNGVARNEPQAGMPADDGDTGHAYYPFRDDFPAVRPGTFDQVTEAWSSELASHVQDGDLIVPPGMIFAMGDNRTESLDGRFWGFVPRANIVGRPSFVYWSFETAADQMEKNSVSERLGFLGHILIHIFDETRWSRTLHRIE